MATSHRRYPAAGVVRELLRGKSLGRTLFNLALGHHTIAGRTLDIGSKSAEGSYYRFLRQRDAEIVCTDLVAGPGVVQLDVEAPFALPDASFDTVLAFHLFEHVFHFERAPHEIHRILKPGGRVLVSTPFMYEVHPDPDDFFRFSDSALRRIWEDAGLRCVHMEAIGEGVLTGALTKLPSLIVPRPLRGLAAALLYGLALPLDRLIALRPPVKGRRVPERFAIDFLAVFEKPAGAAGESAA